MILEEKTPRKTSMRMDRIRQASSGMVLDQEKRVTKHQVSLKNITFEGSQRRLSVLHPSHKMSAKFGSGASIEHGEKIPSVIMNHGLEKEKEQSKGKIDNNNMTSEDHIVSEENNARRQNNQQSGDDVDVPNETKVGTKLKDEIQKNIISMILLVLISIPLLNGDTWYDNVTSYEKSLDELTFFKSKGSHMFDVALNIYLG